ncbi:MAG TPA: GAF domain-containing protein [Casimicrobiaceae bacterium]
MARRPVASKSTSPRAKPAGGRRLQEALDQHAATADILRIISNSRTDAQPVFDTIASTALRLCDAVFSMVCRFDGELIHLGALQDLDVAGTAAFRDVYPCPPNRGGTTQRAILTRQIVHIPDIRRDPEYQYMNVAERADFRSVLSVPMLHDGDAVGAISVFRDVAKPFPQSQIELLKTFAEQAVIAIENVRQFTEVRIRNRELAASLKQQTATSEILRIVGSSRTDAQPVFDAIVRSAVRLCGADHSVAARFDGEMLHPLAYHGFSPGALKIVESTFPMRPSKENMLGRAALRKGVDNLPDMLADPEYSREFALAGGWRSGLAVPMLRDGQLIGAIAVSRKQLGAFPDDLVQLLQTFAEQAVIAIENVRLFTEVQTRNRELTESLEQQTATSDILRVISASRIDVQPVFDVIAENAARLCKAEFCHVFRFDGALLHFEASHGLAAEVIATVARAYPMAVGRGTAAARSILSGAVQLIPDVHADPDYVHGEIAKIVNYRSIVAVPMLRDGVPIGSIAVARSEAGILPDRQVQLLQSFADQAVIAVENVRLFKELEARNRELTESLEQQTATSGILRVIGQSRTDVQPVFDTIAAAAMKLCAASSANVCTFDGEMIHLAALVNATAQGADAVRRLWPHPPGRQMAAARAVLTCDVVSIPDVLDDPDFRVDEAVRASGFRSVLAVPLVREGKPIGAIAVGRPDRGSFPDEQIALLQTFAAQAVIAIDNVRLFTQLQSRNAELTEALEQQTATSEILSLIASSPNDTQPVFDLVAQRAGKLCSAEVAVVSRLNGDIIDMAAMHGAGPDAVEKVRAAYPMRADAQTITARTVRSGKIVHVHDVLAEPDYPTKDFARAANFRAGLGIPIVRDEQVIGTIFVGRSTPGPFRDSQVELLQTFADQAVIAIENVRLFKELEGRTAELTQSVGEMRALGEVGQAVSATLDLETVLRTIVSRANELAAMQGCAIYEYDGQSAEFHLRTADGLPDELVAALRADPIRKGEGALGQLAVVGEPVQVTDIVDGRVYQSRVREILLRLGYRSLLAVPLQRENDLLGGLVVNRMTAGEFAPEIIALLQTFASQSALAIQNARLFREIEDKSRQLEVASEHKSEFLANMSHELRTPLNAIIGFSEVLAEKMFGEVNDKQAEYLADILDSGRHLLSLINDILDLSKIEAGRMELNLSEFSLPSAIDNTLMLLRERAHRRDIALACTIDDGLGSIQADERKVKQVVLNLLSNALKFTPEGGRIDVRAARRNGCAEIAVTDTGVGIAPDDQAAVFEEFRQVGTASKKVEGTGLGLAISRKFIELHGGRIWVESTLGEGSTFAFTLPLFREITPAA